MAEHVRSPMESHSLEVVMVVLRPGVPLDFDPRDQGNYRRLKALPAEHVRWVSVNYRCPTPSLLYNGVEIFPTVFMLKAIYSTVRVVCDESEDAPPMHPDGVPVIPQVLFDQRRQMRSEFLSGRRGEVW